MSYYSLKNHTWSDPEDRTRDTRIERPRAPSHTVNVRKVKQLISLINPESPRSLNNRRIKNSNLKRVTSRCFFLEENTSRPMKKLKYIVEID